MPYEIYQRPREIRLRESFDVFVFVLFCFLFLFFIFVFCFLLIKMTD